MANITTLLTEHIDIWTAAESEKKSGRGRASGNTGSVYGVKKLRELILELAVRGKLVPQDPNDEPAYEVLGQNQSKVSKKISLENSHDETQIKPPIGWATAKLSAITLALNQGVNTAADKIIYSNEGYKILQSKHITSGVICNDDARYVNKVDFNNYKDRFSPIKGDILFANIGTIGKSALVLDNEEFLVAWNIFIIRPFEEISSKYLKVVLDSFDCSGYFEKFTSGSATKFVSKSTISDMPIPVPPFAEQHRIVAKVDELMALCDQLEQQHSNAQEVHENLVSQLLATLTQSQNAAEFNANWQRIYPHFDVLFTTEASIEALKQTLLQLAVMGKLVPQDLNDEPASELLKRIQAEKAKLIAEGKLRKEKPLAPIAEDEKPFELPKGWEWVRLGSITNFGVTEKLNNITNDTWVLDLEDIEKDTSVIIQKNRFLEKQSLSDKNNFKKGDVLYGKLRPYLNKVVIADEDGVCTTEILPIRCYGPFVNKYFMYALKAPHFIEYVNARSYGMKMPRLGTDDGRNSLFPLAPLSEQHRIVAKVDDLMALCDQLKTRIQQASQQKQLIADALVAQAVA